MATTSPYFDEALAPFGESVAKRPGFFNRLIAAMVASRMATARREIARHAHLIAEMDALSERSSIDSKSLPF